MRTITTTIYEYSELSETAKEKARDWYRINIPYSWGNEAIDSLRGFAEHFDIEKFNYTVDFYQTGHSSWDGETHTFDSDDQDDEDWLRGRVSVLRTDDGCQFTGYCMDDACNDGAVAAYKNGERDLKEIIEAGFRTWLKACHDEVEYQYSEGAIAETMDANNYEFTEAGVRI